MRASFVALPLAAVFCCFPLACAGTGPGTSGDGDGDGDGDMPPAGNVCTGGDYTFATPPADPLLEDGSAPDWSCIGNPVVVGPGTTATVEGCIEIFGIGSKSKPGIRLAVFSRDQDPSTDTPTYGEVEVAVAAQAGPLQELARDCDSEGYYRIEGIPTHEPLIWKVYDSDVGAQKVAIDTYSYDIFFLNDEVEEGVIDYEANLIYRSTYDSIPTLGGKRVDGQADISDGVGRSVIAGEVHDCNDDLVTNAVVISDMSDTETVTRYFNGDQDDPQPDLTITATNTDGLYMHLNATTDPGVNAHTVAAGVLDTDCEGDDCQCLTVGLSTVLTFPDSVSIITLVGDLPVVE
jgi:hypothetical protein